MDDGRERNLRLLAPVAVAVFAFLLLVVVLGSGALSGGGSGSDTSVSGSRSAERSARRLGHSRRAHGRASYTIKAGDTLALIASRNGTTVERIQELNPQLDPEALTAGQRIRLR